MINNSEEDRPDGGFFDRNPIHDLGDFSVSYAKKMERLVDRYERACRELQGTKLAFVLNALALRNSVLLDRMSEEDKRKADYFIQLFQYNLATKPPDAETGPKHSGGAS